ncbi:MAG: hypothetical protein AAGD25_16020 [Cyanobacteria bacterium P01_F01_bin.150]
MTSNPRFDQYVERVQENLAIFSLSDDQATKFLRQSDSIANYDPSFAVFEILINDSSKDGSQSIRKFDPHVSSKLLEKFTPEFSDSALERLDANADLLEKEYKREIDWKSINLSVEEAENEFINLSDEIESLFKIHLGIRGEHKHARSLDKLERRRPEDLVKFRPDLEKVATTLKKLVRRYEREYLPSNLAASALIYESWRFGTLQALGNPESDEAAFNCLLDALFINTKESSYEDPLIKMAQDLGLSHLSQPEQSFLKSGEKWLRRPEKLWVTCIERALIHNLLFDETPSDTYIIHFPLIIDNYRFVGFCYLVTRISSEEMDSKDSTPEIFIRDKYAKFFCIIQSVSETLRLSLRTDALENVIRCLEVNKNETVSEIFPQVARDYFVCFDVLKDDEYPDNALNDSLNTQVLYGGNGIKIYGPEWVSEEHKKLMKGEIEGQIHPSMAYSIPGLYEDVKDRVDQFRSNQRRAKEDQAGLFSHQASGLVAEAWCDPGMQDLRAQSQGCLWQLKTLIDIWGNFDLEEDIPLSEGPQDFPELWIELSGEELLEHLINTAIIHALRRATYRRSGENPDINDSSRRKAFEIRRSSKRIELFKKWVGLEIDKSELQSYPEWLNFRGFIICFHHCFWQAAFHGFRARCDSDELNHKWFVKVKITDNFVEVSNKKLGDSLNNSGFKPSSSRDADFLESLRDRLKKFSVEGPQPLDDSPDTWQAKISYSHLLQKQTTDYAAQV